MTVRFTKIVAEVIAIALIVRSARKDITIIHRIAGVLDQMASLIVGIVGGIVVLAVKVEAWIPTGEVICITGGRRDSTHRTIVPVALKRSIAILKSLRTSLVQPGESHTILTVQARKSSPEAMLEVPHYNLTIDGPEVNRESINGSKTGQ